MRTPGAASLAAIEAGAQRRAAILWFIGGWIECYGFSPTVREITAGVGLKSAGATEHHLAQLQADGWITRGAPGTPRSARTIRLAGPAAGGGGRKGAQEQ